jgi:hypothetical protein
MVDAGCRIVVFLKDIPSGENGFEIYYIRYMETSGMDLPKVGRSSMLHQGMKAVAMII